MISAYEHGRTAAKHGKHIQACPFDTGTPEWREWRKGFCDELVTWSSLDVLADVPHELSAQIGDGGEDATGDDVALARGHDLRHGGSAVRTRHARDLRRSNRTPDRARAGTVEALCRDGGIIPGENILKVNVYITSVEMFPALNEVYRRYFPKDPRGFSSTSLPGTAGSTSR